MTGTPQFGDLRGLDYSPINRPLNDRSTGEYQHSAFRLASHPALHPNRHLEMILGIEYDLEPLDSYKTPMRNTVTGSDLQSISVKTKN